MLHKNMDCLDFHADNLEWGRESSPVYQEYKEDMDNLTVKLNSGHPNPVPFGADVSNIIIRNISVGI